MAGLTDAKYIGGIGSVLMLLAIVPEAGFILFLIGVVMVAIAAKRISDVVEDPSIFRNMLLGIILLIVGGFAGVAVGLALGLWRIFQLISTIPLSGDFQFDFDDPQLLSILMDIAIAVLAALVIIWVFAIVSSIFLRKSFVSMSKRLGVGLFSTVGLLYLIGAASAIVLIGFLILFIAVIIQVIAFFTMPEQPPTPETQVQ